MNLARYISEDLIDLHLPPPAEPPDNPELNMQKWQQRQKENLLETFVALLDKSGLVLHRRKLLTDLINRERQASTGLSHGVAVPHVRTRYVRDVMIAFARSSEGYEFDSVDNLPSHLFFIIVSPSHIGDLHIKIYKQIAEIFSFSNAFDELMAVEEAGEVIRILRRFE
ncbi:MAG: PTS sugar transporter subunit IIA [Deferribacteres bacterium]|nr:PTS sugar transporter subunit IIA [candidate division KSB1 bacterium]MCB9508666.1 PTS sugar transporter subunit IIA [Deferribacteres bacterium]